MTKINHIFIDLDGVLANFIGSAFRVHGSEYVEETYPRLEWDINKILGITDDAFWSKIDGAAPHFWPGLEPYPWLEELVAFAKDIAPVSLLSSPSKHPSCHYGKRQWCDRYLPGLELILCKSKQHLAAPGRVLIDDNDGNIAKWRSNGGIGILFAQPWNYNHPLIGERVEHCLDSLRAIDVPARQLIAFTGYARAGKDEAGEALMNDGYVRHCFGDIIKDQLSPLCHEHLGFSAHTEDDQQKRQVRPILEHWGDVNYDGIFREYFATLPEKAVNTRLVRVREAIEWRKRSGLVVEIQRPGFGPASDWERDRLEELRAAGLIDTTIVNDGTVADLHEKVRDLVDIQWDDTAIYEPTVDVN